MEGSRWTNRCGYLLHYWSQKPRHTRTRVRKAAGEKSLMKWDCGIKETRGGARRLMSNRHYLPCFRCGSIRTKNFGVALFDTVYVLYTTVSQNPTGTWESQSEISEEMVMLCLARLADVSSIKRHPPPPAFCHQLLLVSLTRSLG